MTSPAPETHWFVLIDGKPYGPCTTAEMHDWLASGKLRAGDLAAVDKAETAPEWKRIWQFSEFERRGDRKSQRSDLPSSLASLTGAEIRAMASRDLPTRLAEIPRIRLAPVDARRIRLIGWLVIAALLLFGVWLEFPRAKTRPAPKRDTPANREGNLAPYELPEGHPPVNLPDPSEHKPVFLLPGKRMINPDIPPNSKP